jgi:hypothetical protein
VTTTFNEAMAANSLTAANFRLRRGSATGALVARAVSYNATNKTATLNPSANLLANTNYSAQFSVD